MAEARALRRGPLVTYSPKVFIPLTTLCRDVCGYCTFARPPRRGERAYMPLEEVLEIARAGAAAGARRRSSRSATSPSCATASPARSSRPSASRRRSSTSRTAPGRARGNRPPSPPQPGRDDACRARAAPAGLGVDGDHARDGRRPARRSGAVRTGPRPTRCPRRGSRRSGWRASSRSRSRAGS